MSGDQAVCAEEYAQSALEHYVTCALWSSIMEDGQTPYDTAGHTIDTMAARALEEMTSELEEFARANADDLKGVTPEQFGHDFWLTRNGHGTGFWDRGRGEAGERLSEAARKAGERYLYVGDDGKVDHDGAQGS